MGAIRLRDEEHARRVAVQAVHDAGALDASDALPVAHVVQERVHERARGVAGSGMDDEPRRLVDREQVVVFVQDRQRNRLGLQSRS